jgi:hypothetical protein
MVTDQAPVLLHAILNLRKGRDWAIAGSDEIQYARGHDQIEQQCTRLLWIGCERTTVSFGEFVQLVQN